MKRGNRLLTIFVEIYVCDVLLISLILFYYLEFLKFIIPSFFIYRLKSSIEDE